MNTETKTKTSRISLWKSRKADSRATHYGSLELTPETIQYLASAEPNKFGMVKLDVLIFKNDRGGEKAPGWAGYVNAPKDRPNTEREEF